MDSGLKVMSSNGSSTPTEEISGYRERRILHVVLHFSFLQMDE